MTPAGEQPASWRSPIRMVDGDPVDTPAIGDWCAVSQHEELLRIEAILPRHTCITRALASGRRASQVLAANVDVAFLVTGLDKDFSLRRIERYLALARSSGVRPVVILNKEDLCEQASVRAREAERVAPGVTVISLSAFEHDVAATLRDQLSSGQTAVFLGSSGVGKSTLINRLLGETRQTTAPVSARDDRGCHTTTHRELMAIPNLGAVIDTPGLREVGVIADGESLDLAFEDIAQLAADCRFHDCRHEGEPGCAVKAACASALLDQERLDSYIRLRQESENAALRQDAYAYRDKERRTVGRYRKWLKEVYRLKGR
jgi:ribosome biogenesis GTPase